MSLQVSHPLKEGFILTQMPQQTQSYFLLPDRMVVVDLLPVSHLQQEVQYKFNMSHPNHRRGQNTVFPEYDPVNSGLKQVLVNTRRVNEVWSRYGER